MFLLLSKNRKATHNILSTMVIFLLMTIGVTYMTVQVAPILRTLQKGTSEKTQEAVFYSIAEQIDAFLYADTGYSITVPINNPYHLRYNLDMDHTLKIQITGTTNTPTLTYNWGLLNATLFTNQAQKALPPYLFRGGSGFGLTSLINAQSTNSEGENTVFFIQQLKDGTIQYVVMPRVFATTISSRAGFADLIIYVLTLVTLDDDTGKTVGFPNDLPQLTLNMTVSSRTTFRQGLGTTNGPLTLQQTYDGHELENIVFPDVPTGTVITLKLVEITLQLSTL